MAVLICAFLANLAPLKAQRSGLIAGIVRDADGPLAGAVVMAIHIFAPAGDLVEPKIVVSNRDGVFHFQDVAEGSYRLCASLAGSTALNPCEWSPLPPLANVRPGEAVTGFELRMERGQRLHLRITDTGKRLARVNKRGGPGLLAMVWDERGQLHPPVLVAADDSLQLYSVVVPFDRDLRVKVQGKKIKLKDKNGNALTGAEPSQPFRVGRNDTAKDLEFSVADVEQ